MEEVVYLNGAMLPRSQAKVSSLDYGFLFGYGLFETMRAYNGAVFRLDSHLDRLARSARALGIPVDISVLKQAITDTIRTNGLASARVRITVSAGEGSPVPDPRTCQRPTVLIVATEYKPYPREVYERGFRLIFSKIRRNSWSPVTGMKTANYLESLLAREEARAAGVDDAVLLNERGQITEASASNIFLVEQKTLKTPRIESGILPGITRSVILELAARLGITARQADIPPGELRAADEAFLTGSMIEVMPVTMVADRTIGSGKPGAVTRQLMSAYRELALAGTG